MAQNKKKLKAQQLVQHLRSTFEGSATTQELQDVVRIAEEINLRKIESLRLYVPTLYQDEAHKCAVTNRIVSGGNQCGKSLWAAVEVARAALGRDPYNKYRKPEGEIDFIIFIVGYDQKHVGRRLHRYLFRAGAFDIIRDLKTQEWRAYDPLKDKKLAHLRKPAPPLIPPRMIKSIAWANKAAKVFDSVTLHNGAEIFAFPSKGEPPQGDQVDLYWIDEDIEYDDWVDEAHQRLSKRSGFFIWSALPKSKNTALIDMMELAETEEKAKNPNCVAYRWSFLDNPHIAAEEKAKRVKELSARGQEYLRLRIYGDPQANHWLMYPEFSIDTHGLDRDELPKRGIPHDWCRYKITDPGRTRAGVLLAALPPPDSKFAKKYGNCIVVYGEVILKDCNAAKYASAVKRKCGDDIFWEWIIDEHGGRIRDMGPRSKPVKWYYADELKKKGMLSQSIGANFVPGCDDIEARVEAVASWLTIRPDGTTKLRVLRGALPEFQREIRKYRKKVDQRTGLVMDRPQYGRMQELMNCLEYLAARNPRYHPPVRKSRKPKSWAARRMEEKKKRREENREPGHIVLN